MNAKTELELLKRFDDMQDGEMIEITNVQVCKHLFELNPYLAILVGHLNDLRKIKRQCERPGPVLQTAIDSNKKEIIHVLGDFVSCRWLTRLLLRRPYVSPRHESEGYQAACSGQIELLDEKHGPP